MVPSNAQVTVEGRRLIRGPRSNADVVINAGHAAGIPTDSGALAVLAGASDGISPSHVTVISQDTTTPGVAGDNDAATDDFFGLSLATGDLAAGAHGDTTGRGAVSVFYGTSAGIFANADRFITESTGPINGDPVDDEHFGHGVRILDTDGDGRAELIVTAPKEDGTHQTAAAWTLKINGSGTGATIANAVRADRDTLFDSSCTADPTTSCFGPGFPLAGAVTGPVELPETGPYITKPKFTPYLEGFPPTSRRHSVNARPGRRHPAAGAMRSCTRRRNRPVAEMNGGWASLSPR